MSAEAAKNLRMELHYGIEFIEKALDEGTNKTGAITKLSEARFAMAAYISSLKGKYYFAATADTGTNVIEMDPDVVDESSLPKEVPSSVESIKTSIAAIGMGVEKILSIRLSRLQPMDPKNSYRALRSLDRAVDSLESCVGYLVNELQDISAKEPGKYPTFRPEELETARTATQFDPAANTNSLMEERAGVTGVSGDTADSTEEKIEDTEEGKEDQGLDSQLDNNSGENENLPNGDGNGPLDQTDGSDSSTGNNTTEEQ